MIVGSQGCHKGAFEQACARRPGAQVYRLLASGAMWVANPRIILHNQVHGASVEGRGQEAAIFTEIGPNTLPKEMDNLVVRDCSLIDMFAKSVYFDWSFPTRGPMASMVTLLEFELLLMAVR